MSLKESPPPPYNRRLLPLVTRGLRSGNSTITLPSLSGSTDDDDGRVDDDDDDCLLVIFLLSLLVERSLLPLGSNEAALRQDIPIGSIGAVCFLEGPPPALLLPLSSLDDEDEDDETGGRRSFFLRVILFRLVEASFTEGRLLSENDTII